ncbi:hypothetical protein MHB46_22425 [Paenibacillus sp. FSL H7-0703]|uniref:hypothetical protein n=1 Tax=unclassified Paenibacillus TaxID=185978 RepID=UPI0013EB5141|nr:hypothetical protein [Paenibacillus sp. EKM212P]KAF6578496.1 hypothetical protein G9G54_14655 [Paenibacillus sp. EKM212P]
MHPYSILLTALNMPYVVIMIPYFPPTIRHPNFYYTISAGTGRKFTNGDKSVFYHPEAGMHEGSDIGLSSGQTGKVKVRGSDYKPLPGGKATLFKNKRGLLCVEKISIEKLMELYVNTIDKCGTYLLSEDDMVIGYNIFEEFDTGVISFLHADILQKLNHAGLISDEMVYKVLF